MTILEIYLERIVDLWLTGKITWSEMVEVCGNVASL